MGAHRKQDQASGNERFFELPVQISAHASNRAMFGGLKKSLNPMFPARTSIKRVVSSPDWATR